MKILKLMMIALLAVTAVSCSGDDDNGPAAREYNQANLVGVYAITAFEFEATEVEDVNGIDVTSTIVGVGDTFQNAQFEFTAAGTVIQSGLFRLVTSITVGAQTQTENEIIELDETGTYTVFESTNGLALSIDGDIINGTVIEFTDDRMVFEALESEVDSDGSYTSTTTITLERI